MGTGSLRNGIPRQRSNEFWILLGDGPGCVVHCTHARGEARFTLEEGSSGPRSVRLPWPDREDDAHYVRMVQAVREFLESHGFEVEP